MYVVGTYIWAKMVLQMTSLSLLLYFSCSKNGMVNYHEFTLQLSKLLKPIQALDPHLSSLTGRDYGDPKVKKYVNIEALASLYHNGFKGTCIETDIYILCTYGGKNQRFPGSLMKAGIPRNSCLCQWKGREGEEENSCILIQTSKFSSL